MTKVAAALSTSCSVAASACWTVSTRGASSWTSSESSTPLASPTSHIESPIRPAAAEAGTGEWTGAAQRLSQDLGGEFQILEAEGPVEAVLSFAYQKHVTQILVGESLRSRWQELLRGSFVNSLIQKGVEHRHPRHRSKGAVDLPGSPASLPKCSAISAQRRRTDRRTNPTKAGSSVCVGPRSCGYSA